MSDVTIKGWPESSLNVGTIEEIKEVVKNRTAICYWRPPTYDYKGQIILNTVMAVVNFAVAAWSAVEYMRIFRMQHQIADAYASMQEEDWRRYNEKYRPLENLMINECLNEAEPEVDYDKVEALHDEFHTAASGEADAVLNKLFSQYRLCPDDSVSASYNLRRRESRDDLVNYGFRDAEFFRELEADWRFSRRANLLNLGRDFASNSAKFAQASAGMLSNLGSAAAEALNGSLYFLGHWANRNPTQYPAMPAGFTETGGQTTIPTITSSQLMSAFPAQSTFF